MSGPDLSNMLGTETGTLVGVPIPEEYEQKSIAIQRAVEQAVEESEPTGIAKRGKEVTPWILAKVKELTGGGSVQSSAYDPMRPGKLLNVCRYRLDRE